MGIQFIKVLALIPVVAILASCNGPETSFRPGTMTGSQTFSDEFYSPDAQEVKDTSLLTIRGENIVIDFGGLTIDARDLHDTPDSFAGIAIRVLDSRNVEIRNLNVHGFKIAVYAQNVDSLKIIDCNFSYNYRPHLNSRWEKEALSDWLYFHNNESDEWLRYGGAVYLTQCNNALIKGIRIRQGFNGLMMDRCNDGLVYNNDIRFNSGLGIGMYRSSRNRIMHNRLDWNVRGYSHGQYDRGQDSAGILLYEQCNDNTIAYNSATHSGDGLFLWAGQETMDSGRGGCNGNVIYRNDFSHSVANGVEATFSSNAIIGNKLNDCRYGIWAGYSYRTLMSDNEIHDCDHGIAIEHGNFNIIESNSFENSPSAIELWERPSQPTGWGFADKRNVESEHYTIAHNTFEDIGTAITLTNTDSVHVWANSFAGTRDVISKVGDSRTYSDSVQYGLWEGFTPPAPLEDGMDTELESEYPRGRKYMLVNEWGPYDFSYPDIFLRRITDERDVDFNHTFALFGPVGNWKLLPGARGISSFRPKSGATPSTIELKALPDSALLRFDLEYLGPDYVDQFGDTVGRGAAPIITYLRFDPGITWSISYFNYDDSIPPADLEGYVANHSAAASGSGDQLAMTFWREPMVGVQADRFITHVTGSGHFADGNYEITLESDDGVRMAIDGVDVITNTDPHTPEIDKAQVHLSGIHDFEIYHFDTGGLSVLDLVIRPLEIPNKEDSIQ